jgi:hypothetical protein
MPDSIDFDDLVRGAVLKKKGAAVKGAKKGASTKLSPGQVAAKQLVDLFSKRRTKAKQKSELATGLDKLSKQLKQLRPRQKAAFRKIVDREIAKRSQKQLELAIADVEKSGASEEAVQKEFADDVKMLDRFLKDLLAGDPVGQKEILGGRLAAHYMGGTVLEGGDLKAIRERLKAGVAPVKKQVKKAPKTAIDAAIDEFVSGAGLPKGVAKAAKRAAGLMGDAKSNTERARIAKAFGEALFVAGTAKVMSEAAKQGIKITKAAGKKLGRILADALVTRLSALKEYGMSALSKIIGGAEGLLDNRQMALELLQMGLDKGRQLFSRLFGAIRRSAGIPGGDDDDEDAPDGGVGPTRSPEDVIASALAAIPSIQDIQAGEPMADNRFDAVRAAAAAVPDASSKLLDSLALDRQSSEQDAAAQAAVEQQTRQATIEAAIRDAVPAPEVPAAPEAPVAPVEPADPAAPGRTFLQKAADMGTIATGAVAAGKVASYSLKKAYDAVGGVKSAASAVSSAINKARGRALPEDIDDDVLDTMPPPFDPPDGGEAGAIGDPVDGVLPIAEPDDGAGVGPIADDPDEFFDVSEEFGPEDFFEPEWIPPTPGAPGPIPFERPVTRLGIPDIPFPGYREREIAQELPDAPGSPVPGVPDDESAIIDYRKLTTNVDELKRELEVLQARDARGEDVAEEASKVSSRIRMGELLQTRLLRRVGIRAENESPPVEKPSSPTGSVGTIASIIRHERALGEAGALGGPRNSVEEADPDDTREAIPVAAPVVSDDPTTMARNEASHRIIRNTIFKNPVDEADVESLRDEARSADSNAGIIGAIDEALGGVRNESARVARNRFTDADAQADAYVRHANRIGELRAALVNHGTHEPLVVANALRPLGDRDVFNEFVAGGPGTGVSPGALDARADALIDHISSGPSRYWPEHLQIPNNDDEIDQLDDIRRRLEREVTNRPTTRRRPGVESPEAPRGLSRLEGSRSAKIALVRRRLKRVPRASAPYGHCGGRNGQAYSDGSEDDPRGCRVD